MTDWDSPETRAAGACIEAGARAFYEWDHGSGERGESTTWDDEEPGVRQWYRHGMADGLRAAFVAVTEEPCATCHGTGDDPDDDGRGPGVLACPDHPKPAFAAPTVLANLGVLEAVEWNVRPLGLEETVYRIAPVTREVSP